MSEIKNEMELQLQNVTKYSTKDSTEDLFGYFFTILCYTNVSM